MHRFIRDHNPYYLLILTLQSKFHHKMNTWQCLWLNLLLFKLMVRIMGLSIICKGVEEVVLLTRLFVSHAPQHTRTGGHEQHQALPNLRP